MTRAYRKFLGGLSTSIIRRYLPSGSVSGRSEPWPGIRSESPCRKREENACQTAEQKAPEPALDNLPIVCGIGAVRRSQAHTTRSQISPQGRCTFGQMIGNQYVAVNRWFAETVARDAEPDDQIVLVQVNRQRTKRPPNDSESEYPLDSLRRCLLEALFLRFREDRSPKPSSNQLRRILAIPIH